MKKIIVCLCFPALASCSAHHHLYREKNHTTISEAKKDGLSYEKAIVIDEKTETAGVAAEYAWLKKNYPGYKMRTQSLSKHDNKFYDLLNITTADGEEKTCYFDISNFYGKGFGF